MKDSSIFELSNGLQCAFQQNRSTVAHIAVAIKAGSRDELAHQQGLAHFIAVSYTHLTLPTTPYV